MKAFQTVPPRPEDVDVPTAVLVQQMAVCRRVQTLLEARLRTASPSDQIAYAYDVWLVTHPKAPIATDETYPGWSEHIAALVKKNKQPKETA